MSESKHVWVFLETEDGQLRSVGLELLGQGRLLADKMGEQLVGVILDPHAGTLAAQAIGCGADTVITMEDPALAHYNTDIFTAAMCRLVRKYAPEVLMIGATNVGRDLGPRISCPAAHGADGRLHASRRGRAPLRALDAAGLRRQSDGDQYLPRHEAADGHRAAERVPRAGI